jgi:hypothetical protein
MKRMLHLILITSALALAAGKVEVTADKVQDQTHPQPWAKAIEALSGHSKLMQVLFFQASTPAGDRLREKAAAAGLREPEKREKFS